MTIEWIVPEQPDLDLPLTRACSYESVDGAQELWPDERGYCTDRSDPLRFVIMRGSQHYMMSLYSLNQRPPWMRHHVSANGYCIEVIKRWCRRRKLTALNINDFHKAVDDACSNLAKKYRLTFHFYDAFGVYSCHSDGLAVGYFEDDLYCWIDGVHLAIPLKHMVDIARYFFNRPNQMVKADIFAFFNQQRLDADRYSSSRLARDNAEILAMKTRLTEQQQSMKDRFEEKKKKLTQKFKGFPRRTRRETAILRAVEQLGLIEKEDFK